MLLWKIKILQCRLRSSYVKSVSRNSNLLLGMAIGTSGRFEDEEQFRAFGRLLRKTFGQAIAEKECESTEAKTLKLKMPDDKNGKYLALREKTDNGQRIRGFRVSVDGRAVYESNCIGHKRIIPMNIHAGSTVTVEITDAIDGWKLRNIAVY